VDAISKTNSASKVTGLQTELDGARDAASQYALDLKSVSEDRDRLLQNTTVDVRALTTNSR
jgi:hypothetical protein